MFIPHKDRLAILTHVFREGVIAAKLDFTQPKHAQIAVPNIYVCNLMKSLTSKKYAKRTYSWGWAYWVLTEAGIEAIRAMLHLPEGTVPNTFKKVEVAKLPEAFQQRSNTARPTRGREGGRPGAFAGRENKDFSRDGARPSRGGAGGRGGRGRFGERSERAPRAPRAEAQ